jgi:hypothetical protein
VSWLLIILLASYVAFLGQPRVGMAHPVTVILGVSAFLTPLVAVVLGLVALFVDPERAGCTTGFAIPIGLVAWYEAAFIIKFYC